MGRVPFRAVALLPLTSPSAMPSWLQAGAVPVWEPALVFAIPMTGKEPSWREIARGLRQR